MLVSDFDYELPEALIAQEPAARRERSRLLVVDRAKRTFTDSIFERLIGRRLRETPRGEIILGGRAEVFLVTRLEPMVWEALVRPGKSLLPGARVEFARGKLTCEVIHWREFGRRIIRFEADGDFDEIVDRIGRTPLPPYIKRDEEDRLDAERYQTVYASERGAVAAPTAGLHFTRELLDLLGERGVEIAEITLHVGYGTFQPVRVERVEDHHVEPERYSISEEAARTINRALKENRRVIAVGTTTTRALESAARRGDEGVSEAQSGKQQNRDLIHPLTLSSLHPHTATTDLFIYPGFEFRVISGLLTNFHLPESSLLMLVSAFGSRELVLEAYRHAVKSEYHFYSYGDAMLIL